MAQVTWFALAHGAAFAALLWALLAARRWPLLFALLTWPGTAVHELLHYLAGWLAGARPVSLSVLPRRHGDRWSVIDGDRMRMLSVPEAKLAMGFPPSYAVPEVRRDAMHLLGNAVCPIVVADFLEELKRVA